MNEDYYVQNIRPSSNTTLRQQVVFFLGAALATVLLYMFIPIVWWMGFFATSWMGFCLVIEFFSDREARKNYRNNVGESVIELYDVIIEQNKWDGKRNKPVVCLGRIGLGPQKYTKFELFDMIQFTNEERLILSHAFKLVEDMTFSQKANDQKKIQSRNRVSLDKEMKDYHDDKKHASI